MIFCTTVTFVRYFLCVDLASFVGNIVPFIFQDFDFQVESTFLIRNQFTTEIA
jgi:hypothetical protein